MPTSLLPTQLRRLPLKCIDMKRNRRSINKVRASRDGHEFHEAWAARKALQLVFPGDDLVGIAVEGPAPEDEKAASASSVEVSDLVLFYGERPDFATARKVAILQFKYSIRNKRKPVRVSDVKDTIEKFADSYLDHKQRYGARRVASKLAFELVTNRPIDEALQKAIEKTATGARPSKEEKSQTDQFKAASGLKSKELAEFAGKIRLTGLTGNLKDSKSNLTRILADWSATSSDALAQARLGKLRDLVRDKAGDAGDGRNVILRTDVFAALGVSGIEELLPSPESFPDVGKVVEREQLEDAVRLIAKAKRPFLIHAEGGIGKTVFMQSLAKALSETHKTILFDCFGGGGYRSPEDARHLPRKGLIHIANLLATEGFCDPLLPGHDNADEIIAHFRKRITQAVKTLRRASSKARLIIFLDAIDNAAIEAKDRDEDSFPQLLLNSWRRSGPIDGVQLIVSCRTEPERRTLAVGSVPCEELSLKPFSRGEATQYLKTRVKKATKTEIEVAYARSQGNPRILKHLAEGDRGLLEESEINKEIILDDLLALRISDALEEATKHGYSDETIKAFLAGLAVLPPPVPIKEYADAHSMSDSAIQSFAADLYPLLEKTKHGLVFRDEPTETLVRNKYADDVATLRRIADNLFKKQSESVYAAAALPGLLQKIDAGDLLFKLALDDRFPAAITSDVGKREIRYSRLKAAIRYAASKSDFSQLVHLLVEISTIAAVNQRGAEYIKDNPALVVASGDIDATRRLFDTRTSWPGTRHARIAIANVLSNDLGEAQRHVVSAIDWINHAWRQKHDPQVKRSGPEILDLASVPFCRIAEGRPANAVKALRTLTDWAAFEVTNNVLSLLDQAVRAGVIAQTRISEFRSELKSEIGALASVLSFNEPRVPSSKELVRKLATAIKKKKQVKSKNQFDIGDNYGIYGGLERAAMVAILGGLHKEAENILSAVPEERPGYWNYVDQYPSGSSNSFVRRTVLTCVAAKRNLDDRDLLPKELVGIGKSIDPTVTGDAFRKAVLSELDKQYKAQAPAEKKRDEIGYEDKRRVEEFLNQRQESLLRIARAFEQVLSAKKAKVDAAFVNLLDVWADLSNVQDEYTDRQRGRIFFDLLGRSLIHFGIWARADLKAESIKTAVRKFESFKSTNASFLIDILEILAKRPSWHASIDAVAVKTRDLITLEDEISRRGSMFAQLGNAILPASKDEASAHFRIGLKEMDAFGSGDYYYINDLLWFASTLTGDELAEQDFHSLSNLCEMNMASEEEKFPWFAFAKGMAAAAGPRMLAKLGRWDDRNKIALEYTLLPFCTALIERRKITPEVALGLMQLADPAELHSCGTGTFASALHNNTYPNEKTLVRELLRQFSENNPDIPSRSATDELRKIAEEVFGTESEEAIHLRAAAPIYSKLIDEQNDYRNYHGSDDPLARRDLGKEIQKKRRALQLIASRTDPSNELSMAKAIEALNKGNYGYDVKDEFFDSIRSRVSFSDRSKYIRIVANSEGFYFYWKLHEITRCRQEWAAASPGLEKTFQDLAIPLIQIQLDKFVKDETLSGYLLKEVSDFTGIGLAELAAELIKVLAKSKDFYSAAIWMGLATIINERAPSGEAQAALHRLLTGNAVRLANGVLDGPWKKSLYPAASESELAAGLLWLRLGSPSAAQRWRAAHAIRCFGHLGRWDVVNAVVSRLDATNAGEFQAPELHFYFLHAKLWLLIALARLALDEPAAVASHKDILMAIIKGGEQPHVLMRQFAADALAACHRAGAIELSPEDVAGVAATNTSPYPRIKYDKTKHLQRAHQSDRPQNQARPTNYFSLEYDFEKYDSVHLANAFGRPNWEIKDSVSHWVRKFDATVRSMYESGGRSVRGSRGYGLVSHYHVYGQYLGWSCICFVAADLLAKHPVHEAYSEEDSWTDWLKRRLLTRSDGLWLSDGMDSTPLETQVNLVEKDDKGLVLTGNKEKLLQLAGIGKKLGKELIVKGNWKSADGINVFISSALIPERDAEGFATELAKTKPFHAWLPTLDACDGSDEYERNEKDGCEAWIVCPSPETRLDEDDPLGAHSAMRRPYLKKEIRALYSLISTDAFNRRWVTPEGVAVAHAEAWGREYKYRENGSQTGERLACTSEFLGKVLATKKTSLVLLINVQRYNEKTHKGHGFFTNSSTVVVINPALRMKYFPGLVNWSSEDE